MAFKRYTVTRKNSALKGMERDFAVGLSETGKGRDEDFPNCDAYLDDLTESEFNDFKLGDIIEADLSPQVRKPVSK